MSALRLVLRVEDNEASDFHRVPLPVNPCKKIWCKHLLHKAVNSGNKHLNCKC